LAKDPVATQKVAQTTPKAVPLPLFSANQHSFFETLKTKG